MRVEEAVHKDTIRLRLSAWIKMAVVGSKGFSNDVEFLIACAARGLGLAFVAEPEVSRELAAGILETTLDDFSSDVAELFLCFPRAARDAPKVRAFIACAKDIANPTVRK